MTVFILYFLAYAWVWIRIQDFPDHPAHVTFSEGFLKSAQRAKYGSYDNMYLLTEWEGQTGKYWAQCQFIRAECSEPNIFLSGPT